MKRAVAFLYFLFVILINGCKKKDDTPCVAGKGGNIVVTAYPEHHGYTFSSPSTYPDTAYVKFNSNNYPGENPALYDATVVGTAGENHISITGLKCGNYFVYVTGFHTSSNVRVKGGIPFSLTKDNKALSLNVPVE